MKIVYFLLLGYSFSLSAMQEPEIFSQKSLIDEVYNGLRPEILVDDVSHSQYPEEVKGALTQLGTIYYNLRKDMDDDSPYTQEVFIASLIETKITLQKDTMPKATDHLTARMYAFRELTVEEQQSLYYGNDPEVVSAAQKKYHTLLDKKLRALNLG